LNASIISELITGIVASRLRRYQNCKTYGLLACVFAAACMSFQCFALNENYCLSFVSNHLCYGKSMIAITPATGAAAVATTTK